jgi:hypothetical protein
VRALKGKPSNFSNRHNVVRKYWWENPHHVIASACLRSLTQDVGRDPLSNGLAKRDLLGLFSDPAKLVAPTVLQWSKVVSRVVNLGRTELAVLKSPLAA